MHRAARQRTLPCLAWLPRLDTASSSATSRDYEQCQLSLWQLSHVTSDSSLESAPGLGAPTQAKRSSGRADNRHLVSNPVPPALQLLLAGTMIRKAWSPNS